MTSGKPRYVRPSKQVETFHKKARKKKCAGKFAGLEYEQTEYDIDNLESISKETLLDFHELRISDAFEQIMGGFWDGKQGKFDLGKTDVEIGLLKMLLAVHSLAQSIGIPIDDLFESFMNEKIANLEVSGENVINIYPYIYKSDAYYRHETSR